MAVTHTWAFSALNADHSDTIDQKIARWLLRGQDTGAGSRNKRACHLANKVSKGPVARSGHAGHVARAAGDDVEGLEEEAASAGADGPVKRNAPGRVRRQNV